MSGNTADFSPGTLMELERPGLYKPLRACSLNNIQGDGWEIKIIH